MDGTSVELEAPNDANSKLQEVMDNMLTEKLSVQTEKIGRVGRLLLAIKQMLSGRKDASSSQPWGVAVHRLVRPHERSLEPLTETDGDDTMMDNLGDDDAGSSAVKNRKSANEAIGSRDCDPRSMWSLSASRLVPRFCLEHWAVRCSQTTARRSKQFVCGKHGLQVLH